jgi:4-cresol dehydrogenase (hydroxylating)
MDAAFARAVGPAAKRRKEGITHVSNERRNDAALTAWRAVLGTEGLATGVFALGAMQRSTIGWKTKPTAILSPANANEVQALVRVAAEHRVPLYPISTGHNWGYGTANAPVDGCAIVSLARMQRIELDAELGTVTLEPGVTQGQLWQYLDERGLPFLVPVHGGGPTCSIVGNLLERGYGITPVADHFGAMTSLEAVLADGSLYRSSLAELGGAALDRAFKWGVGPYLDGLFTQGAFGIVTEASIALARKPEQTDIFLFTVPKEEAFPAAVVAVREILRKISGVLGSINLMNGERVVSMFCPHPTDRTPPGQAVPGDVMNELMQQNGIGPWTGLGALYGTKHVVRAARRTVKEALRDCTTELRFVSSQMFDRLRPVLGWVKPVLGNRWSQRVSALQSALRFLNGVPDERALKLAYWKSGKTPSEGALLDPARDGCGLIWYSPLVLMTPEQTTTYVKRTREICLAHQCDPLITLTSLSERAFDSTVPILFDPALPGALEQAHACFGALLEGGKQIGAVPYRYGVKHMAGLVDPSQRAWQLVRELKQAVDPQGIISPGRYC